MGGPLGAGDPAELGATGSCGGSDRAGWAPSTWGRTRRVRPFRTAPVLDARLDGEPLFVVAESVEGPDLGRAVAEKEPLRGSDTETPAVGVATALSAIHAAGIVHRARPRPVRPSKRPNRPRAADRCQAACSSQN